MKNLLLLFLFTFVWVCLLPLYPSVSVKEENPVPEDEYVISVMLGMTEDILPPESLKAIETIDSGSKNRIRIYLDLLEKILNYKN